MYIYIYMYVYIYIYMYVYIYIWYVQHLTISDMFPDPWLSESGWETGTTFQPQLHSARVTGRSRGVPKGGGFSPVIRMCSRLKPKRTLSERSPETATGNRHDVSWTENDLVKEDPGWPNSMFFWGEILSVTHQVPLSKEVLMLPSDCSTLESMLNSLRVRLPGKQWCGWSLYPAHSTPSITTVIHRQWQGLQLFTAILQLHPSLLKSPTFDHLTSLLIWVCLKKRYTPKSIASWFSSQNMQVCWIFLRYAPSSNKFLIPKYTDSKIFLSQLLGLVIPLLSGKINIWHRPTSIGIPVSFTPRSKAASLKTMEVSCVTMAKGHQHVEVVVPSSGREMDGWLKMITGGAFQWC